MKYYQINYEDGRFNHGDFNSYYDALIYAEDFAQGQDFTIEEYESVEDYENSL